MSQPENGALKGPNPTGAELTVEFLTFRTSEVAIVLGQTLRENRRPRQFAPAYWTLCEVVNKSLRWSFFLFRKKSGMSEVLFVLLCFLASPSIYTEFKPPQ